LNELGGRGAGGAPVGFGGKRKGGLHGKRWMWEREVPGEIPICEVIGRKK
jgi:hypothetical protein